MYIDDATRRELLGTISGLLLLTSLTSKSVWAGGIPKSLDIWAKEAIGLKDELQSGKISVLEWQRRIEKLNTSVPIDGLKKYLDLDNLAKNFTYETRLADMADPILPKELLGANGMKKWFIRVFAMRNNGAIIPHIHNNMVSSHLVISGSFKAVLHDRIEDMENAVRLKQTFDGIIKTGEIISMSDMKNNQHWLVAQENNSMTLDIGIVSLPPSWEYGLKANKYNMIYIDPTVANECDGTIIAPIIEWETAAKRFADFTS